MDQTDDATWCALQDSQLSAAAVSQWLARPDCGAVVVFEGLTRDHSEDADGVSSLEFEAYEEYAVPKMHDVVEEMRRRWPDVRHVALLHRTGAVPLSEAAVIVGVSSPHRDAAFAAARYGIDALKATVPLWKVEHGVDGTSHGPNAQHLAQAGDVPS